MKKTFYLNLANFSKPRTQTNHWSVYHLAQILGFLAWLFLSPSLVAQRPTINNFSPTSGPIGTSVTITGTQFNTTAAQNIVYFGATRATVTFASPTTTSLTVTVPTGATYQPITVLNNATNLVGSSTKPFNVTFTGIITPTFLDPKVDFTTGTNAISVSMGDLDGDGKPDLAVANYGINTVSIFRNTASVGSITASSFANKVDFTTGTGPYSVSIGDLDGDGKPDLAVANYNGNTVSILRQISTASSIMSGNWEDTTTWKNGLIPQIGDLVVISLNHTVTLNSIRDAKYLRCKSNAQLQYGNTTAKLKIGF